MPLPILDEAFNAPALRAWVDILFLLAGSLHQHRRALFSATRAAPAGYPWLKYVSALADAFGDQIKDTGQRQDVYLVLDAFECNVFVRKSDPSIQAALALVRSEIDGKLRAGTDPLDYLSTANGRAHAAVRALLQEHGFATRLPAEPVPIRISPSALAEQSCASSSQLAGEIYWDFQPTSLAFWGALAAEMVLQHEYLSHLAPYNPDLSSHVREGWLMEVLMGEVHRNKLPESPFDIGVLHLFRDRLESLGETGFKAYSEPGMREVAREMRARKPELFWKITGEMLEMAPSAEGAKRVADFLLLAADSFAELPGILLESEWEGLGALYARLKSRPGFP